MRVLTSITAAAVLASAIVAGDVNAGPLFWAINQFNTIQKLDGDTGAVVDSFAVPFGSGSAASIAVIGNIGYYTLLGDPNAYKVDMTTHLATGTAFTTIVSGNNGITPDAAGHLWFAGANSSPLLEYDTAGNLLSSHAFPVSAGSYRDGSVVFGGMVIANRGDQIGPYDKYTIPGGNGALVVDTLNFIAAGSGSNGIAFNGINFYTSDEQLHKVSKWDVNGNFVSIADLDPNSRYENWTFASQDIIVDPNPVPEPTTVALFGLALVGITLTRNRKSA